MPPRAVVKQKEEAREAKLAEVARQVAAGELRVRQATAQERAEWAAEGRGNGQTDAAAAAARITPSERAAMLVGRVALVVEATPGASLAEVRRQVGGRAEYVSTALEQLITEGRVERRREGRGYRHHTLAAFAATAAEKKGGGDGRA